MKIVNCIFVTIFCYSWPTLCCDVSASVIYSPLKRAEKFSFVNIYTYPEGALIPFPFGSTECVIDNVIIWAPSSSERADLKAYTAISGRFVEKLDAFVKFRVFSNSKQLETLRNLELPVTSIEFSSILWSNDYPLSCHVVPGPSMIGTVVSEYWYASYLNDNSEIELYVIAVQVECDKPVDHSDANIIAITIYKGCAVGK